MQLVYKFQHHEHKTELKELCSQSLLIYNKGIELTTQNPELRNYNNLDSHFEVHEKELYRSMKSHCVQQKLKEVCKNWTNYYASIEEFSRNPERYNFKKPNPPKVKTKIDQHIVYFTNQVCQIRDNKIVFNKKFDIPIPDYKDFNEKFSIIEYKKAKKGKKKIRTQQFQQIRILPFKTHYEIEIVYEVDEINHELDIERKLSGDLGVNNLIAMISNDPKLRPFILSGELIKSINQHYNKEKARLQKELPEGQYKSKRIYELIKKRKDKITNLFHKISSFIVAYCLKYGIGHLIIGYNKWWKDSINIGKQNNQKFYYIPYTLLLKQLEYKCFMVGIKFEVVEESYTSKCDALALESLEHHESYLGKRVKRGLFVSSIGKAINADINGAINIMRKKVVDESFVKRIVDSGLLYNPLRLRLSKVDVLKKYLLNI